MFTACPTTLMAQRQKAPLSNPLLPLPIRSGSRFFCRSELAREEPEGEAFIQNQRGALEFFASKLAPTVILCRFHLRDQVSHPSKAQLSPPHFRVYACSHSGPILAYATTFVATPKISCPLDQLSISDFVPTRNMERAQNLAWNALIQVSHCVAMAPRFLHTCGRFYL